MFAEIVLGKAGEIFTPDELKIYTIEKDIVQIFIKGLNIQARGPLKFAENWTLSILVLVLNGIFHIC